MAPGAGAGIAARLATVLYNVVEGVRIASALLAPAMPGKAGEIRTALGLGPVTFADVERWGGAEVGGTMPASAPALFPRVDTRAGRPESKKVKQEEHEEGQVEEGTITIDDFARVQLQVAEVVAAEKVPKTDKLLKLSLRVGDAERTVVSGIAEHYTAEDLVGRKLVVVANLKPAKLRGITSEGMILAAEDADGQLALAEVPREFPSGATVR